MIHGQTSVVIRASVGVIVAIAFTFAAAAGAGTVPSPTVAQGKLASVTPSRVTVKLTTRSGAGVSCLRESSWSPDLAAFRVDQKVTMTCRHGVAVGMVAGSGALYVNPGGSMRP